MGMRHTSCCRNDIKFKPETEIEEKQSYRIATSTLRWAVTIQVFESLFFYFHFLASVKTTRKDCAQKKINMVYTLLVAVRGYVNVECWWAYVVICSGTSDSRSHILPHIHCWVAWTDNWMQSAEARVSINDERSANLERNINFLEIAWKAFPKSDII